MNPHHRCRLVGSLGLLLSSMAFAAEPVADPAGVILENLRAANVARAALAGEQSAWNAERQRLEAVAEAVAADIARLEREAAAAEAKRADLEAELARLGTGSDDLEPIRAALAEQATMIRETLRELANRMPPGAVAIPSAAGEAAFDDVIRALDATERASTGVAIEVVTGELAGVQVAVKALRVAGAGAWWVNLEGNDAGILSVREGKTVLTGATDESTRKQIMLAVAIAEDRHPAELLVLPMDAGDKP